MTLDGPQDSAVIGNRLKLDYSASAPVITCHRDYHPEFKERSSLRIDIGAIPDPELSEFIDIERVTKEQLVGLLRNAGMDFLYLQDRPNSIFIFPSENESLENLYDRFHNLFEHLASSVEADPVNLVNVSSSQDWRKCRGPKTIDWEAIDEKTVEVTTSIFCHTLCELANLHLPPSENGHRNKMLELLQAELTDTVGNFVRKCSPSGSTQVSFERGTEFPKPTPENPRPFKKLLENKVQRIHPNDPLACQFLTFLIEETIQHVVSSLDITYSDSRPLLNETWTLSSDLLNDRLLAQT